MYCGSSLPSPIFSTLVHSATGDGGLWDCEMMENVAVWNIWRPLWFLYNHCRWVLIRVRIFVSGNYNLGKKKLLVLFTDNWSSGQVSREMRNVMVGLRWEGVLLPFIREDCYIQKQGCHHQQILSAGQLPCPHFFFVPWSFQASGLLWLSIDLEIFSVSLVDIGCIPHKCTRTCWILIHVQVALVAD